MQRWILLVIAMFSTACLAQGQVNPMPLETPGVELMTTPFSIPECKPAVGVTFKLQRISDYLVELIASGLKPGETPYVYYMTNGKGGGFPGNIVRESGELFTDLNWSDFRADLLEPPEGQLSATWDITLVHVRGVECAAITLP